MLIGARNGMLVKSGWKNPYVTDGLVAMWDGEWNAGGGKHDPNATVWKDLIGGNDVGSFVSGVSFGDNYFHLPATKDAASFTPYAVGYIKTIEIVIKPEGNGGVVFVCFSALNNNANRWFGIRANSTFNFAHQGDCASVSTPTNLHYYAGTSSSDATIVVPFSGLYLDGTSQTNLFGGMSWGSSVSAGRFNAVASSYAASNIYTIRLYSRELTASEIAVNYAVDKARFGLP